MEGVELFAELLEVVVKGNAGATVEHVVPVALGIEVIEEDGVAGGRFSWQLPMRKPEQCRLSVG